MDQKRIALISFRLLGLAALATLCGFGSLGQVARLIGFALAAAAFVACVLALLLSLGEG